MIEEDGILDEFMASKNQMMLLFKKSVIEQDNQIITILI